MLILIWKQTPYILIKHSVNQCHMSTETKVVEVLHSLLNISEGLHRDELVTKQRIKSANNSKRQSH